MSCSNIPTKVSLRLDKNDNFVSFDFLKLACNCNPSNNNISNYFEGNTLNEIFEISLSKAFVDFKIKSEEKEFMFKLEYDALKAAIANYLGIENETVDKDRCQILSIDHNDNGTTVNMVILPPKA